MLSLEKGLKKVCWVFMSNSNSRMDRPCATIEYRCEHTDRVDPHNLKPHPKNPNKHPRKQIAILAANIKEVGWRHPIVVSKLSGFIVCGHGRRQAAIELGCTAPVDYQDFESEAEELAVLMADNMIPELAEWDAELKVANLEEIRVSGLDELVLAPDKIDDLPTEVPEIEITEKLSLERVTVFVEETLKKEVVKQFRDIATKYDECLVRIVT